MQNYILKFKIILSYVFIVILFLSVGNIYSQNSDTNNSSDETILRTDSLGNILGGIRVVGILVKKIIRIESGIAEMPELPGCIADGESYEEVLKI